MLTEMDTVFRRETNVEIQAFRARTKGVDAES